MFPRNNVLQHPAAKMLLKWATQGCPLNCGSDWDLNRMEAAINKAAHPSAQSREAAKACRAKAIKRLLWLYKL